MLITVYRGEKKDVEFCLHADEELSTLRARDNWSTQNISNVLSCNYVI